MKFALVVAADQKNGIGKNNTLVWKLPTDLKFFTDITTNTKDPAKKNVVIMGRKTWESLPTKHRPLKNRLNIILTRDKTHTRDQEPGHQGGFIEQNFFWADSIDTALDICRNQPNIENILVIGGANLYAQAIIHPDCQTIYLTRIEKTFDCDAFFPPIDEKIFELKNRSGMKHENDLDFEFLTYERRNTI